MVPVGDKEKVVTSRTTDGKMKKFKMSKNSGLTPVEEKSKDDPCWDGYKQVGMKKKSGKEVPNCVPEGVKESKDDMEYKGWLKIYNKSPDAAESHPKHTQFLARYKKEQK